MFADRTTNPGSMLHEVAPVAPGTAISGVPVIEVLIFAGLADTEIWTVPARAEADTEAVVPVMFAEFDRDPAGAETVAIAGGPNRNTPWPASPGGATT
jgi:hypothetical protein